MRTMQVFSMAVIVASCAATQTPKDTEAVAGVSYRMLKGWRSVSPEIRFAEGLVIRLNPAIVLVLLNDSIDGGLSVEMSEYAKGSPAALADANLEQLRRLNIGTNDIRRQPDFVSFRTDIGKSKGKVIYRRSADSSDIVLYITATWDADKDAQAMRQFDIIAESIRLR